MEKRQMIPQRVTVWSGGIIVPFFFEDDNGNTYGERYNNMINERYLFPGLEGMDINRMLFQQDGGHLSQGS